MGKEKRKLQRIILYFLKIGTIGFGGSVAITHLMHRDLVDKRKWINHDEYVRGLTLSGLIPGPLSAQMATYIGYVYAGAVGATAASISFILPSFLMVLGFSAIYFKLGNIFLIQNALYGIAAAVIGILSYSAIELISKTIKPKLFLWAIMGLMFLYTSIFRRTNILLFIFVGLVTMLIYTKNRDYALGKIKNFLFTLFPIMPIATPIFLKLPEFFLKAGILAFGGGLAIIPFLHTGVVSQFHWLTNKEFLEAMAIAMITPGPVAISATFIGYAVSGMMGAIEATVAIFLPVYFLVILLTPLLIKHSKNPQISAFVEGVTAASMGAVGGSIIILGQESIVDYQTAAIAVGGFILSKYFKMPTVITVILAGILGIILKAVS